jgi:hypothetical protein
MQPKGSKIWFPAKTGFGWGWGPPVCWQGWAVLGVWIALVAGGPFLIQENGLYVAYCVILALALTAICYLKGEKPRWRWGKD